MYVKVFFQQRFNIYRYSFFPNITLVIDQVPDYLGFDIDTRYLMKQAKGFFPSMRGKRSIQAKNQQEDIPRKPTERFVYNSNEECWHYLKGSLGMLQAPSAQSGFSR